MTKTTDTRQIGLLIQGILRKYGIDNLQLEIDLTSAIKIYFEQAYKKENKAEMRERILADIGVFAEKVKKNEQMESRIFQATGLYVNDRWYRDGVIEFLLEKDSLGETIEKFAETCKSNPYTMPKFFKIAEKPAYLKDVWGLAFTDKQDEMDIQSERASHMEIL